MNLFMFILLSLLMLKFSLSQHIREFILLILISNFAELESYITFGAIKPISDVKFILRSMNTKSYVIYIPGIILLVLGLYFLDTYILMENEFGYSIFEAVFYIIACSSRIILTRPSSKI
ncbi:MAG: hypothetical protein ACLSV2_02515 [Clostridium sp.]